MKRTNSKRPRFHPPWQQDGQESRGQSSSLAQFVIAILPMAASSDQFCLHRTISPHIGALRHDISNVADVLLFRCSQVVRDDVVGVRRIYDPRPNKRVAEIFKHSLDALL